MTVNRPFLPAVNTMTHPQISSAALDSLSVGERALFQVPVDHLTDAQRINRERILSTFGVTPQRPRIRVADPREIARIQKARQEANNAVRLSIDLGISAYLTKAPARAFYELARKFAKQHRKGQEPVFDAPRACLATDAKISLSSVATMRRIAIEKGWLTVEVQPCAKNPETDKLEQQPSIYRPGPLMWKAIFHMSKTKAYSSSLSVQKVKQTGEYLYKPSSTSTESTQVELSGRVSYRSASGSPETRCHVSKSEASRPNKRQRATTNKKVCLGGSEYGQPETDYTPPGAGIDDLIELSFAGLSSLSETSKPKYATQSEIIKQAEFLRPILAPELTDAVWKRALDSRGLYAVTVFAALAINQRSRTNKPIRSPAGWFQKMVWQAPKLDGFDFENIATTILKHVEYKTVKAEVQI